MCNASTHLEIEKIESLQGSLKTITDARKQKLKNSLIQNGFIDPLRIWEVSGKYYSLDGVHRKDAIIDLKKNGIDVDGKHFDVIVPDKFPVVHCYPKNKKEAKKWILAMSSEYAKITEEGLYDFLDEAEIEIEEVEMFLDSSEITDDHDYPEEKEFDDELKRSPKGCLVQVGEFRFLLNQKEYVSWKDNLMNEHVINEVEVEKWIRQKLTLN